MNMLKEKKNVVIAIVIALLVIIAIIVGITLRQKPTVANNDNTETENVIDTEDDTMTMVADGDDSTQNDTTESENVSGTEDSEVKEEETDLQTPSSEEDKKDDESDDKKDDETDDKKDDETDDKKDDDTDDGKDDVDDSEEESEETEDEKELSPSEQAVVNAGYGKVVLLPTGNYGVLVHNDGYANGKNGADILVEYLAAMDLEASSIGGCYIDADKDWYWYIARDVHEIDHSDDDWTDEGEIEFID